MNATTKYFTHIEMLKEYPDLLTLENLRVILDVQSNKTASKWLRAREKEIGYFRIGHDYRIPKANLVNYFLNCSRLSSVSSASSATKRQPGE